MSDKKPIADATKALLDDYEIAEVIKTLAEICRQEEARYSKVRTSRGAADAWRELGQMLERIHRWFRRLDRMQGAK